MKTALLFVGVVFFTSLCAQQNTTATQLDEVLTLLYKTDRFNGTVLYAEKGKVMYKKAFGITDSRTGGKLTTKSSFNLASVTKQFICTGILMLHEKALLNIDDDVKKYIPELPYDHISIRNLMTHTSGIAEYFDLFQHYRGTLDTLTNEMMIQQFAQYKPALEFKTGTTWSYCNTNYVLLASIIERVSGNSIKDFIAEAIVKPLGLEDTYVYTDLMRTIPENHVYGFTEVNGAKKLNDLTNLDGVVGDGNIYSSAEDLYKWEQSFYSERLLKKTTIQQMFTPVKLSGDSTFGYGFGWFIDSAGIYSHTGGWAGFRNIICRDVNNNRTLVVLSSGDNATAIQLAKKIFMRQQFEVKPLSLITNIKLIDGTGTPARNASVRIEGGKIIAVGNLHPFANETVIDGKGKVLTPGFIDTHSHLEGSLQQSPEAIAALNQGITTIVGGQDGESDAVDAIKQSIKAKPVAVNVATYTGHTTIREKVLGANQLNRTATQEEIVQMQQLLKAELDKGSLGLSSGLEYEGAFYSNRHEVIELAKTTAAPKGRYISHIRSEDITMKDAIDEIINIGREAKLPVQISHIKIALKDDWGTAPDLLAQLQQARSNGIDITADCYPYNFWNSTLRVLFPKKDFTSITGAKYAADHLFDASGSVLVKFKPDSTYKNKTIAAIAAMRKELPEQTLLYLVSAAEKYEQQHAGESAETIMGKAMSDDDIAQFLSWQHTNICSDGAIGGHPRAFGSFTKVLGYYVREKKIMTLETAINKMTALAAEHTGIKDRGVIAAGYYADLVLFDADTVKDNADIKNPAALSDGILKVWVNGTLVYDNKKSTNQYPGVFITR